MLIETTENMEVFLAKIKEILIVERSLQKESFERGEKYNIFKTLGLSRNETRLHSAFLAELLNPYGAHGLNDQFLKAFLSLIIDDEQFLFNTKKAVVYVEFDIGRKTDTTGGRIDILLKDDRRNGIVIENKIDACDQENQLLRYDNYAKSQFDNYKILYLTKRGCEATDYSLGKSIIRYNCISYQFDIISWLERCMELTYNHSLVRETIKQYVTNLQEIMNIMSEKTIDVFLKTAVNDKYIKETLKIIENTYRIENQIRKIYIEQLIEIAKKYNLECKNEGSIENFKSNSWIYFYNKEKSSRWSICIGNYGTGYNNGYLYGVSYYNGVEMPYDNVLLEKIKQKYGHIFDRDNTLDFPLGYSYLWGEEGIENIGLWYKWDNTQTLLDMYEGKIAKYLEENLFKPVLVNKWLEKIEEIEKQLK